MLTIYSMFKWLKKEWKMDPGELEGTYDLGPSIVRRRSPNRCSVFNIGMYLFAGYATYIGGLSLWELISPLTLDGYLLFFRPMVDFSKFFFRYIDTIGVGLIYNGYEYRVNIVQHAFSVVSILGLIFFAISMFEVRYQKFVSERKLILEARYLATMVRNMIIFYIPPIFLIVFAASFTVENKYMDFYHIYSFSYHFGNFPLVSMPAVYFISLFMICVFLPHYLAIVHVFLKYRRFNYRYILHGHFNIRREKL